MKQIIGSLLGFKGKISHIFQNRQINSQNKTENHFHGPVYFMGKMPTKLKEDLKNLPKATKS